MPRLFILCVILRASTDLRSPRHFAHCRSSIHSTITTLLTDIYKRPCVRFLCSSPFVWRNDRIYTNSCFIGKAEEFFYSLSQSVPTTQIQWEQHRVDPSWIGECSLCVVFYPISCLGNTSPFSCLSCPLLPIISILVLSYLKLLSKHHKRNIVLYFLMLEFSCVKFLFMLFVYVLNVWRRWST